MGNRKAASRSIIHAVTKVYRAGEYVTVTCVRARQMRKGKARRKRGGKIR